MTTKPKRTPGGVPDLSTVNAVELTDALDHAWTKSTQLHLVLSALALQARHHQDAAHAHELEAAFELADDMRDCMADIRTTLGATPEEVAI
ncbi:hypothetical protein [Geminicoccus roseus]|uniref:hypothetical protein n=1 Tax=Geminicoccus roseus TaxID=404900 RepID=UPI00040D5A8B|nr:hypothetical protein [Geminicoccus roseus]